MNRHSPGSWLAVSIVAGLLLTGGCAQDRGSVAQGPVLQPLPKETKVAKEAKAAPQPVPVLPPGPAEVQPQKAEATDTQPSIVKETAKKPAIRSTIVTAKLALLADPRLFRRDIEVGQVEQGIILSGKVASEEEKLAATEVAKSVEGVPSVINKLQVVNDRLRDVPQQELRVPFRAMDEQITHSLKERFLKSTTLKTAGFDVKTENGIVSLSGNVRFQVVALEAAETARDIPGVKAVKTDEIRLEGVN